MKVSRICAGLVALSMLALAGCGGKKGPSVDSVYGTPAPTGVGVNGLLWRAALDTLSFLPMADLDAAGGAILSEWYVSPDVNAERVKVAVYIVDDRLRADAIKVTVNRQRLTDGIWVAAPVQAGTEQKIEDAILDQARILRQDLFGDG